MTIAPDAFAHVAKHSTPEERKLLEEAGFVHVTGLNPVDIYGKEDRKPIGHHLRPNDLGRYDSNNSMAVIVTTGGEVWLACQTNQSMKWRYDSIHTALTTLCPNEKGTFVPCSNGEQLHWRDLLHRIADPDYVPSR